MNKFNEWTFEDYLKKSTETDEIHWWHLPKGTFLKIEPFPKKIKKIRDRITVKRLLKEIGKNKSIEGDIKCISIKKDENIKIIFPIRLDNVDYVKIYALMISEGSARTEFSIHCPETEFHVIFKKTINNLLGSAFGNRITRKSKRGIERSRAPQSLRFLIPLPEHIPKMILENKKFSKEYLKIAFEAEGSAIFNKNKGKRYIKLSRSVDVSKLINKKLKYNKGQRIYAGKLKHDYPKICEKLSRYPPITLIGEHLILKHYFDIGNTLKFEALRFNRTSIRRGFYSARWVLIIYANNIDKFIGEIGFITKKKQGICKEMKHVKSHRPQYFAFDIIKKIAINNIFYSKDFVEEMEKLGYAAPRAFISRYLKKGLLKKFGKGKYEIIAYPQA